MSATYAYYSVPEYITGAITAVFALFILIGGVKRIGFFSSIRVPIICLLYLGISCLIIFSNITLLKEAFCSIFANAFSPTAATGGFVGATIGMSMRQGIFKAAFITEAGVGTAAISHSLANTDNPINQGIVAMYSIIGEMLNCFMSGLITLITGVWQLGRISNDLTLISFKTVLPTIGPVFYTILVTLFIIGTTIGNCLNGSKSFAFFTNNKFMNFYYVIIFFTIFFGAIFNTTTLWNIAEIILPIIMIPHVIGLIILTLRHRKELSA